MANRKIFPTKDASMYTDNPILNTGLDEILEASTTLGVSNFTPKDFTNDLPFFNLLYCYNST